MAKDLVQVSWVCQNIPSDFCRSGPTTYSSIVLGTLCILAVNDSEGGGFIHIQYYLISHLSCGAATWLRCLLLPLFPTQCWVCCIASLHHFLPSASPCWPVSAFAFSVLPLPWPDPGSMKGGLWLQWWRLHSIACLCLCILCATSPLAWSWVYGRWSVAAYHVFLTTCGFFAKPFAYGYGVDGYRCSFDLPDPSHTHAEP